MEARNDKSIAQPFNMVDAEQIQKPASGVALSASRPRGPSKAQQLNNLYSLPAPLRTFALPNFIPHNPISLFHLLYAWVIQAVHPPSSHPEVLYQGWFSQETRSVHITNPKAIRELWERGFYGKGSLSRSEPSWLEREKKRVGIVSSQTSEEITKKRRAERQQIKWERARKERESIDKQLLKERGLVKHSDSLVLNGELHDSTAPRMAPVGPSEILTLPNSLRDMAYINTAQYSDPSGMNEKTEPLSNGNASRMKANLSAKTDSLPIEGISDTKVPDPFSHSNSIGDKNGHALDNSPVSADSYVNGTMESSKQTKPSKCVRFSPKVEQTTFIQSEPPSPELAVTSVANIEDHPLDIQDREHLQLTMEEAFFLSYGLGVLAVSDPKSKLPISIKDLFSIFRQYSYFPPPDTPYMSPDDPFIISYAVYHHFRSLGWVVRAGTKFSVDYLLYNRGPVFSHAEFAILILPSYSDPSWSADANKRDYVAKMGRRRWSWLHCINRVNSQVQKTLVLVYVDIPPPIGAQWVETTGIDGILKQYRIREFVLKRWVSNRSRD